MARKSKLEGVDETCSQKEQLGLLPKRKLWKAHRPKNDFKWLIDSSMILNVDVIILQFVPATYVVTLLLFFSNLYRTYVATYSLYPAINVHQTMWQLIAFFFLT